MDKTSRESGGRLYQMDIDPEDPTSASVTLLLDGDAEGTLGAIVNPDNIDVSSHSIVIQEDRKSGAGTLNFREPGNAFPGDQGYSRVLVYDIATGTIRTVARLGDGGPVEHVNGSDDTDGEFQRLSAERRERWFKAMEPIEPLYYVRRAAPSALLFQSARQDALVPTEDAKRFQRAGSEPKEVIWYDTPHILSAAAACDQAAWLKPQLGLRIEKDLLPIC